MTLFVLPSIFLKDFFSIAIILFIFLWCNVQALLIYYLPTFSINILTTSSVICHTTFFTTFCISLFPRSVFLIVLYNIPAFTILWSNYLFRLLVSSMNKLNYLKCLTCSIAFLFNSVICKITVRYCHVFCFYVLIFIFILVRASFNTVKLNDLTP